MHSVILCEGRTDLVLIQYFMQVSNNWTYEASSKKWIPAFDQEKRLIKDSSVLTIGAVGGCSKLVNFLGKVVEKNIQCSDLKDTTQNIIIITDRDEVSAEVEFKEEITTLFNEKNVEFITGKKIENDSWVECRVKNARQQGIVFKFLLLIIPFQETGALETFLLQAIAKQCAYDATIIDKIGKFVDEIDPEMRYLTKRGYITKSKFDVYFSVRTAVRQYGERQNILKGIPWEEYEDIQASFKKLKTL